jgi:hypothetical protein
VTAVMGVEVTGAIIVLVATIFVGVIVITALGAAAVGEELPKERTKYRPANQGWTNTSGLVTDPYSRF